MIPRTLFTPEHESFRDTVRRFIETEVTPHHADWEKAGQVPRSLWKKAGELGLLCVNAPEAYGGQGADFLYSAILIEEMARAGATGPTFYLHSDIVTIERMQILRDLRLGEFDVLVGINLLREGLDMPEVSLVAIFDADKEGFLRSDTSLIQTIGRSARHVRGKAILYADKITGSMGRAIDETKRRRAKQIEHNALHGLTPVGITKSVADIMEGAYAGQGKTKRGKKVAEGLGRYDLDEPPVPIRDIAKELKRLDEKMYQHARNLEFEEAAQVRDEIGKLRERSLAS
mgnify:CR=1 FL=1